MAGSSIAVTDGVATPTVVSNGAPRRAVRAALRLEFERDSAGRTVLVASEQEPPLRVVRAFELEQGGALVHLHNLSGGLLGGDRLALSVQAGAESAVQITTTGATRVYRPRVQDDQTTQVNEIVVGENALLEYLPDAIIPYSGARFSQRTTIRLEAGAGLFWWEIVAAGREAHGETFAYESLELRTDLFSCGNLVAAERVRLEPSRRGLDVLARMGAYRTWATFYVCKAGVGLARWVEFEAELREIARPWSSPGEGLWGVSALVKDGVVVRCLARSGREVLAGLQALWRAANLRLYGRAAVAPRKVN